jgi:diguanylate cyclase (GGDEF)-like protein
MSSPFARLDARLRRLPDPAVLAIGLAVIACLASFKLIAGRSIPMVDFYLVPVAGVGWLTSSRTYGYVAALTAAVVSIVLAEVTTSPSPPLGAATAAGAARLVLYVVVLSFLSAMRRMQLEHETEARTDALTGAANARSFRDVATAEIERSRRYGHELSLLYLDIDDFKAINDHLGHAEGDDVLVHVSHVLRSVVRSIDTVARLGGDEFAVLMPETDIAAAHTLTMRLKVELARTTAEDGRPVPCSMGLVTFAEAPASLRELLDAGDDLMYQAKQNGKDRIEEAEMGMHVLRAV